MILRQDYAITKADREKQKNQRAFVVWLTGLSGSGKSTIADRLEQYLFEHDNHCYVLDGDNVRLGLNKDLDFSKEGRRENIRRIAEAAKLLCDAGLIVITAFISPYADDREMAKAIIGKDNFFEVFLDASVECCMTRDIKGLYKKAIAGTIENFTGISDAYDVPENPFLTLHTESETADESVNHIILRLQAEKLLRK